MAESDVDEDDSDTALAAAVGRGQFEVVRRIKIEPAQDDVTALANAYRVWPNPKLTEMLIKLGADVRNQLARSIQRFLDSSGVFQHYLELVTDAEAAKWWGLTPITRGVDVARH